MIKCHRNNELEDRQRKGKSKMSAGWKRHFDVYFEPSGLFIPRFRPVSSIDNINAFYFLVHTRGEEYRCCLQLYYLHECAKVHIISLRTESIHSGFSGRLPLVLSHIAMCLAEITCWFLVLLHATTR